MTSTGGATEDPSVGPCPLCGGTSARLQYPGQSSNQPQSSSAYRCTTTTRSRPAVHACTRCGHWFTNPRDWPHALDAEYEQLEDAEYLTLIEAKRRTFRRAADVVQRFVKPPADVLEVGSYAGLFLDELADRGYNAEGVEPSTWGVSASRLRGHRVTQGVASEVLGPTHAGRWDAVVSWDVLEHVPDPRSFVELLCQGVKPKGIVVLSTLDRSNWFPRLLGKRWPWIIPMHLHYFDQGTVTGMARDCGLTYLHTTAHVHYTTPTYALKRLVRKADDGASGPAAAHFIVPVGFGDVRTYVFRRDGSSP